MTKSRAIASWEGFQQELSQRERDIAALLPPHVSRKRFITSAVSAVKQNPGLLECTPRSLMGAVTQSAQDGLLPDGREGVITAYQTRVKKNGKWVNGDLVAKWNPMAWGIRKRARELDGIIIDAQVVYENDEFEREQGDNPRLVHKPAKLGTPRGDMIGVYAIFREKGEILHREVLDADDVAAIRDQSKQPEGLMWTKFASEGWKKSALRRGIKSVPCCEDVERIVRRDDELFDLEPEDTKPKTKVVQPPPEGETKALPPVAGEEEEPGPQGGDDQGSGGSHPADDQGEAGDSAQGDSPDPTSPAASDEKRDPKDPGEIPAFLRRKDSPDRENAEDAEEVEGGQEEEEPEPEGDHFTNQQLADYMTDLEIAYDQCDTPEAVEETYQGFLRGGKPRMLPLDMADAEALYTSAMTRVTGGPES